MSKKVTFHRVTEENDWEGKTWYHYFLDGPDVFTTLDRIICDLEGNDFTDLKTISMTWKEAKILTNQDDGDYMQRHWFGELTNLEGLEFATSKELYKGGIRDFGEELFS